MYLKNAHLLSDNNQVHWCLHMTLKMHRILFINYKLACQKDKIMLLFMCITFLFTFIPFFQVKQVSIQSLKDIEGQSYLLFYTVLPRSYISWKIQDSRYKRNVEMSTLSSKQCNYNNVQIFGDYIMETPNLNFELIH